MKNPNTTYEQLIEFADWVAQQKLVLTISPHASELNNIISRARWLTAETQPSDLHIGSDE